MAKPFKGGSAGEYAPARYFRVGLGGATPPQVSQVGVGRAMMQTGVGRVGTRYIGAGATIFGLGGRAKEGKSLHLSRLSEPFGVGGFSSLGPESIGAINGKWGPAVCFGHTILYT